MEKIKIIEFENKKVGTYNGHDIYVYNSVPKEWVATIDEGNNINIDPEAYGILKDKPEYLKRIYEHEIASGVNHEPHVCVDKDILCYLRDNGYNFGDFKV